MTQRGLRLRKLERYTRRSVAVEHPSKA